MHASGTCLFQGFHTGGDGGPRGANIVHQEYAFPCHHCLIPNVKGLAHIPGSGGSIQADLRRRSPLSPQHERLKGLAGAFRHLLREKGRLVEAALPQPRPVQGYGNDKIGLGQQGRAARSIRRAMKRPASLRSPYLKAWTKVLERSSKTIAARERSQAGGWLKA
jgi:hypothetical protein